MSNKDSYKRIEEFILDGMTQAPAELREEIRHQFMISWGKFEWLSDSHFVKELTNGNSEQFVQRYWEMYIGNRLQNRFRNVVSENIGPDFCVKHKSKGKIWIEAVAPSAGKGENADKIPDEFFGSEDKVLDMPFDQILKRITSAIRTKANKYAKYIEDGLVSPNDSLIIAVNTHLLGPLNSTSITGLPSFLEAVYPFRSDLVFNIENKILVPRFSYNKTIYSHADKEIQTDCLLDKNSILSGVICGSIHPYDRPFKRRLIAAHNYYARRDLKHILPVNQNYWIDGFSGESFNIRHDLRL
jgi:hypothetical protein